MKDILALYVTLFSVCVFGEWTSKVVVFKDMFGQSSYFTDSQSIHTHAVACHSVNGFLYYKTVFPNGATSGLIQLTQDHFCLEEPIVRGLNNGKNVIVVMTAKRGRNQNEKCMESNPAGCDDVYMLESNDGGKTWSKAQVVPRANKQDIVNRGKPTVLLNPNNGRMWIVYQKGTDIRRPRPLMFVTKAGGASLLQKEQLIEKEYDYDPILSRTTLQIFGSKTLIDVYTSDPESYKNIIRLRSRNNGATWEKSTFPRQNLCASKYDKLVFVMPTRSVFPTMLATMCIFRDGGFYVTYSKNDGKTWAKPQKLSMVLLRDPYTFCGHPDKLETQFGMTYAGSLETMHYQVHKLKNGEITQVPDPPYFKQYNFYDCVYYNNANNLHHYAIVNGEHLMYTFPSIK